MKFGLSKLSIILSVFFLARLGNAIDSAYWGGSTSPNAVLTGPLTGGAASVFIGDATSRPCGVFTDAVNEKLYWTDDGGNIQVVNFDGTNHSLLYSESGSLCGVAVDVATNTIYWTNYTMNMIKFASLSNIGGTVAPLYDNTILGTVPTGIAIVSSQ